MGEDIETDPNFSKTLDIFVIKALTVTTTDSDSDVMTLVKIHRK